MTTPDELNRLHCDPVYKEEQEQEYMLLRAVESDLVFLPEYERQIVDSFNRYRSSRGLPPLVKESGLLDLARRSTVRLADDTVNRRDFSLEKLKSELEQGAREFRILSAVFYASAQWSPAPLPAGKLCEHIVENQNEHLENAAFRSVTAGVARRGDLTTVILIYLEQY